MALAWHPIKDGILAFATGEGRVGFFDVNNLSKPPILLKQHHRRCVYSLSWGPPLGRAEVEDPDKPRLFSCGDGDLFQYDMDFPDRDPVNIKELIHESNPSIKKSLVCIYIYYILHKSQEKIFIYNSFLFHKGSNRFSLETGFNIFSSWK